MEQPDRALITDYRQGVEAAFTRLLDRHMASVYHFAYRFTDDRQLAEDITQEVFIKVWKNLKHFDIDRSFRTWLFTIAHHTAIDHLRKKRTLPFSLLTRKNEEGEVSAFEETLVDTEPTPEEYAILEEERAALDAALKKIPAPAREVLFLHHHENLTFEEISHVCGEPMSTVKSRYRRALIALRRTMST